jgi:hypothetical protein
MLLALLYSPDGAILAVAPACDQEPFGERYWREMHFERVNLRDSETAYQEIDDSFLVERLLQLDFRNGHEAAEMVEAHLNGKATVSRFLLVG